MRSGLVVALAIALAGCAPAGSDEADAAPADTISQAARDSAIAESGLPGASVVGRAIDVSETASERAARMDSIH